VINQICPLSSTLKFRPLSSCAIPDALTSEIQAPLRAVSSGPDTLRRPGLCAPGTSHRVGFSVAPVPSGSLNGFHLPWSVTGGCLTGGRQ